MAKVFFSYSHADEAMRDRLETHLAQLKREGVIETWHDRRLVAGTRLDEGIMGEVEAADVFLFLLSADFLASDYCYTVEMARALERVAAGSAAVIPVVLHACDWKRSPLGRFLGVPRDGKPIAKHAYPEDAYLEVTEEVRRAVAATAAPAAPTGTGSMPFSKPAGASAPGSSPAPAAAPRSSNLAIRKTFTDAERHAFLEDGFEFMAKFFEESLAELQRRNAGVEGRFRRNSADAFSARAFVGGKQEAQCRVTLGGTLGGISFSHDADARMGSSNEELTVRIDDQGLTFDALMSGFSGRERKGMSQHGAAEHLWGMFVRSLQGGGR